MRKDVLRQNTRDTIAIVNALLTDAYEASASDLHLVPERNRVLIRFRIDGRLEDAHILPNILHAELVSRIKVQAGLRTDEHACAQDGRFRFRLDEATWIDVRVSIAPTYYGENAVLRLLVLTAKVGSLAGLGMSEEHRMAIEEAVARPNGMILVTGPTGSGKTTTLYTLLTHIAQPDVSVVTIEDPIEYSIDGVNQIPVNERAGLTFANGLRSILRQDPDIIMVGEIRDTETARLAANAALTGHQVFSTLHTNDALSTLVRLQDLGVEPYLTASTLSLVIAQRLARRICTVCATAVPMEESQIVVLQPLVESLPELIVRGAGCTACAGTGYRGRVGIYELLHIDDTLRSGISHRADAASLLSVARAAGYMPMISDGIRKVLDGVTTIEEVMRLTHA